MRKLFLLMAAIAVTAGAGCTSNPCGESRTFSNWFGHKQQPNYACCEPTATYGVPVMQQPTVVQQPCCGN